MCVCLCVLYELFWACGAIWGRDHQIRVWGPIVFTYVWEPGGIACAIIHRTNLGFRTHVNKHEHIDTKAKSSTDPALAKSAWKANSYNIFKLFKLLSTGTPATLVRRAISASEAAEQGVQGTWHANRAWGCG